MIFIEQNYFEMHLRPYGKKLTKCMDGTKEPRAETVSFVKVFQ